MKYLTDFFFCLYKITAMQRYDMTEGEKTKPQKINQEHNQSAMAHPSLIFPYVQVPNKSLWKKANI